MIVNGGHAGMRCGMPPVTGLKTTMNVTGHQHKEGTNAMRRRTFLQRIGMVTAAWCTGARGWSQSRPTRPNILFIMADDHTWQAVASYGSRLKEVCPTSNIDRIAQEGMMLKNCFCTNSICTPSRASILSGQYSHKNGVYTLADDWDPNHRPNLAIKMQEANYETAVIGKWHLHTEPQGFDYYHVLSVCGYGD